MKKSKASGNSNSCVYVGSSTDGRYAVVAVDPDRAAIRLAFTRAEWDAFVSGVKAGEFDWGYLPVDPQFPDAVRQSTDMIGPER